MTAPSLVFGAALDTNRVPGRALGWFGGTAGPDGETIRRAAGPYFTLNQDRRRKCRTRREQGEVMMKKQSLGSDDANGVGIAARVKSGYGLRQVLSLCADEAAASGFPMAGLLVGAAIEAIDDELNGLGMETSPASQVLN